MSFSSGVIMVWLCALSGAAALKSFEMNIAEHKQTPCPICPEGTLLQPDVIFEHKGHRYPCQEAQKRANYPESLKAYGRGPLTCDKARRRWVANCCMQVNPEVNELLEQALEEWVQIGGNENQCRCDEKLRTFGQRVESLEECKQMCLGVSCEQFDYNDKGWCNTYSSKCDLASHCNDGTGWKGFANQKNVKLAFSARNVGNHGHNSRTLASTDTPHMIQVKLVNEGSFPLTFLKWGTPFDDEISYKMFRTLPATSSYVGKVVRRVASATPSRDSLITLKPGEEIANTVDVNKLMAFHEEGLYQVQVDFSVLMFNSSKDLSKPTVPTHTFISSEFQLDVHALRSKADVEGGFGKGSFGMYECSSEQQPKLIAAATEANEMLDDVLEQIDNKHHHQIYKEWLGACPVFDPQVRERLQQVKEDILEGFVADCGQCVKEMSSQYNTAYAYVYPADPRRTIHICGAFFTAPEIVDHSQPGTIIHELLHFHEGRITVDPLQDSAAGKSAIKALAEQTPCVAKTNAANIAAYAESAHGLKLTEGES